MGFINQFITGGPHIVVISWFITALNYRCMYHKPEIGVNSSPTQLSGAQKIVVNICFNTQLEIVCPEIPSGKLT